MFGLSAVIFHHDSDNTGNSYEGEFFCTIYGFFNENIHPRLGSTNIKVDSDTLKTLKRLSENISFDELPLIKAKNEDLDWDLLKQIFQAKRKK